MSPLADAVARLCTDLGTTHLDAVAAVCAVVEAFDGGAKAALSAALPAPRRPALRPLLEAWAATPAVPGATVVIAIDSARAAIRRMDCPEVSVVATGPASPAVPVLMTSQVVLRLLAEARSRITISSFSSYKIPAVMDALGAALGRGVQVDLILESQDNLSGFGGAETFAGYRVFVWPEELRPPFALLHAKVVVVDARVALLTSANLSSAAFERNLEVGARIAGGNVARTVQNHFDALIAAGVLVRQ